MEKDTELPSYNEVVDSVPQDAVKKEHHEMSDLKDTVPERSRGDDDQDERQTWDKKIDFLLSTIGFAVDLANVWRFPYLCYKNGGGTFLIPYFLMLIFGATPLFFMEVALGQFHRRGAITIWWKIAPLFQGVGFCQCMVMYYIGFYYVVIIGWSIYYLFASFTSQLPWTTCGNHWNTPFCSGNNIVADVNASNVTNMGVNISNATDSANMMGVPPALEYFERNVLGLQFSDGLEHVGAPRWQLVLCVIATFVIMYVCIFKGIKISGKVVWVTALLPYVLLTVLLIRGALLPGAKEGILYYLTPRADRLGDVGVWIDAAIQIFYSVGACLSAHVTLASFNKFHHNFYRDCLITVVVNSFTSLFAGFVIFTFLGYMSVRDHLDMEHVATDGPGLVFVVYPEAIATLPGSVAWSILFFLTVFFLGIDSAFAAMEAGLTGFGELLPLKKYRYGRELFLAVIFCCMFLVALPNTTSGGVYLITLWDGFAAYTSILFSALCMSIAVSWFYGLDQFCKDIQQMLGFRPSIYWRLCWKVISPLFILAIVVASIATFRPLSFESFTYGLYQFPEWANAVGWLICVSSMAAVPVLVVFHLVRFPGSLKQKFALSISPECEHDDIKQGAPVKRFTVWHWFNLGRQ